ncbi:hypothetical protein [Paenibacillus apiarius]|uniref:Uncharacterized protein n=1 Tax=Paenibacillus apiarius TaxID=46240 RepID=A0ABT4E1F7_9BACL|nr:hypothetical protein [Paenibacillus apiarius]MCY9517151.1 hypothetical protein [Paenibacillus apiarius]MCY9523450.1 hypothetical protein [Paenibacillus apiarius]MCY9555086.1 hypothetical protein [Paenibacillus apiarius]MCY9561298.1 hypothetical protein [Paenibacillus apiarius]MCY9684586.1 hypothetical protein [Paenibacillus apiarius]
MEYAELVQRVRWGEEFQFYYKNEEYWISTNEEGYYLTRGMDSYTQSFQSAEGLFKEGQIDGKTILEIWDLIEI